MAPCIVLLVLSDLALLARPETESAKSAGKPQNEIALIGRWSFDYDRKGVVVDSGPNGLDAHVKGASEGQPGYQPGMQGKAISFDSGNRMQIAIGPAPALDLRPPFTVAAWIRRKGTEPSSMEILCRADDTGNTGWRLRYGWESLYFVFGDGKKLVSTSSPRFVIPDDKWCHIAATHDGKTVRLFVNCEQVAENKVDASPAPASIPAVIGNYVGRTDVYNFVGLIDELCIVQGALDGEGLFRLATSPARKPAVKTELNDVLPTAPAGREWRLAWSDEAEMKGWAGDLLKAKLPDEFLVDYVRVYDLIIDSK